MSQHPLTRRRFLASLSAGALVALAACQRPIPPPTTEPEPESTPVAPLPLLSVGVAGTSAALQPIARRFSSFLGGVVQGYRVEFAGRAVASTFGNLHVRRLRAHVSHP